MNRTSSSLPMPSSILVEALEPRIAPAGLLNESKFTSITLGTPILLDASGGPNDFQGLTTGSGPYSGSYLLYLTTGKALVFTTDLNGDGVFEPNEITGIALGVDSLGRPANLTLFTNVNGDIVTDLLPGHGVANLSDSDNIPGNGRDGRVLLPTDVGSITLRTLTSADIDTTVPGNTVANRLALTSFSIFGNIYVGGNFGNATDPTSGLHIDTSGAAELAVKFNGVTGDNLFLGATPQVGGIETGSAASNQMFHFTQGPGLNIEGQIQPFVEPAGQHGGDIYNVTAASTTMVYSIGEIITGDGGAGARGGDIHGVTLHGDTGSYEVITGDGGAGALGGAGGSIFDFNDLGTATGQVLLHTGAGGVGTLGAGGPGGTATFATTSIAASVEVFLGNGGDGFTNGGDGSGLASVVLTAPEPTLPIGGHFLGTWHDLGDVGNTHPIFETNPNGTLVLGPDGAPVLLGYAPEAINFNDPSYFVDPAQANNPNLADHYGDGVFTTNTPGQIAVVFGDGNGALNDNQGNFNLSGAETVYLRVPGVVNPVITVGDFNGDGRPDIAVASSDPNNFAGVYVFLDQIGTPLDPINSHNFSRNPLGDHPFSDALQSAIPSLEPYLAVFNGPGAVVGLTTGDFNGDGIADIGIVQQTHPLPGTAVTTAIGFLFGEPSHDANGNTFTHTFTNTITGLSETRIAGSGYFRANLASIGAAPTLQFIGTTDTASTPVLKASSLAVDNFIGSGTTPNSLAAPEVMFYAVQGQKFATEVIGDINPNTHLPNSLLAEIGSIAIGSVDTNRRLPQGNANNITTTDATVQDFTLADLDNDGFMDFVFLSKTPVQFLITYSGDGTGNFTLRSSPMGDQNAGVFLAPGTDAPQTALTLTAVDTNQDGLFDEFGYVRIDINPTRTVVQEIALGGTGNVNDNFYQGPGVSFPGAPTFTNTLDFGILVGDQAVYGLDAFYPTVAFTTAGMVYHSPTTTAYGVISPDISNINFADLFILGDNGSFYARYYTENGYFLDAGNGGASTTGAGGKGGALGAPTLSADSSGNISGAIQITLPMSQDFAGQVFLLAGNGGSGFGGGGSGGSVEGVVVRYAAGTTVLHSDVVIIAGNGGDGIAGNGGGGGGIDNMSVQTGVYFASGNGGTGINGGAGGSIVGNGTETIFDTSSGGAAITVAQANAIGLYVTAETVGPEGFGFGGVGLSAGNGGQGSSVGGNGGSISGWDSAFNPLLGGIGNSLYYSTGFGGSAPSGLGGNGGGITNSSPDAANNNLAGDLHLQTGAGGTGLTGGDGGAITTFVNQPTNQAAVPGLLSVTTGGGGTGIVGNGGAGGAVTGFQANATGLTSELVGFPFVPGGPLTGVGRIIAGDGGASFGAQGGLGGAISNIVAQTTSTPIVVAAGAGGEGLTVGGDGGSVTGTASNHAIINSAAQIGKVLVVAGAGGDAMSALPQQIAIAGDPNTGDIAHIILATGGVAPRAGDGGNISDVTQPTSVTTAVDLIAGNGGSTLNAGTSLDAKTGVGRGGSVTDVAMTGTVGAISRNANLGVPANPPIQAYEYTDASGATQVLSISAIVDIVANPTTPLLVFGDNANDNPSLTGLPGISGNVGIVAGAAGRVRSSQPAQDSVEGSVQNITAQSIMSIVAGSVASVAPVNVLSGITITDPDGVLGVDRTPIPLPATGTVFSGPNGRLDYNAPGAIPGVTPTVTNIAPGYSLVDADGAIFAINIEPGLQGPRVFPAGTVG